MIDGTISRAHQDASGAEKQTDRNLLTQRDYGRALYKERHLVENFLQKIKRNRRVAMRFEKLAVRFLAMVQFAAILVWLA